MTGRNLGLRREEACTLDGDGVRDENHSVGSEAGMAGDQSLAFDASGALL